MPQQTTSIAVPTSHTVPEGWLPVAIGGRYLTVRWIHAEVMSLTEPFFQPSIALLRAGTPSPLECETDSEVLANGLSHCPFVDPAAIIVHMTRCGSTAVVNALRAASDTVTLSEAPPIDNILHLAIAKSDHWASIGKTLLPPLVTAFAQYQGPPHRKVIIKCGIEGALFLPIFKTLWPHVPCLIMVRDPLEVMVSNVQKPGPWFLRLKNAMRLSARHGQESPAEEWVEAGTELIGRTCNAFISNLYDACFLMDFSQLSPASVYEVARRFNLSFSEEGAVRFHESFSRYSKDTKRAFDEDPEQKRRDASETLKSYVAKWAAEPYRQLRETALAEKYPTV